MTEKKIRLICNLYYYLMSKNRGTLREGCDRCQLSTKDKGRTLKRQRMDIGLPMRIHPCEVAAVCKREIKHKKPELTEKTEVIIQTILEKVRSHEDLATLILEMSFNRTLPIQLEMIDKRGQKTEVEEVGSLKDTPRGSDEFGNIVFYLKKELEDSGFSLHQKERSQATFTS